MENEWWYNEKIINPLVENKPNGFDYSADFKGGFSFSKSDGKRILYTGCGNILKNSLLRGVGAGISFVEIEVILHSKFEKNPIYDNGGTLDTRNHGLIFNQDHGKGIYEYLPLELDTDEAMQKATELIQKYIKEYAQPFFEYWTDIRCFLPFIENASLTGLHDYFAGYAIEKKLIIWKLCNHPNFKVYQEERTGAYENYLKQNPGEISIQKDYKVFLSFLKKLEKVKPKYEWDEKYLELQKGNPIFPEE